MKRLLITTTLAALACLSALGQSGGVGQIWTVVSGSLQSGATANGNGTALAVSGLSVATLTVNCSVACSGGTLINFEGSEDNTNYVALNAAQLGTSTIATTVLNQGTTPTVWSISVAGLQSIRARISSYSAGTITVTGHATATPTSGASSSLSVNNGTTDGGTPRVTLSSDSTGQVKLAAGSAVVGHVIADTGSTTAVTGNPGVTQSGTWTVQPGNTANTTAWKVDGSAVTQPVSAASLPLPSGAATTAKQPALGTAGSASSDVITIQGVASMTKLLVTPDSVALPANQSVNESQINGVTPLMGNGATGTGSQRVTIASDNTAFSVNAAATLASETTKVIGTARLLGNVGGAVDAATGAAPPANAILHGGLGSGATGGFVLAMPTCDSFVNINIVTATTTLLVTGVSGRHVRICSLNMIAAAADNVGIISGTGATCGTGSAAIVGTTAATGYNLAANGGIAAGSGLGTIMRTVATGDSVCAITSAATQLSGVIGYAIY